MANKKENDSKNNLPFDEALKHFEKDRSYITGKPPLVLKKHKPAVSTEQPEINYENFRCLETGQKDSFFQTGLQRSIIKRLKRGHFPISARCDLHGFRFKEALYELTAFFDQIKNHKMCTILIIHGKGLSSAGGKPVLKPLVREYLLRKTNVLAFMPAPKNCGGDGATLVLLKRWTEGHISN
ncbi:MAG: Smr/MutS family protein [Pseudomonadota bacterium]|nr:Smr/MutS family protein [Pseudomonadota bacterium]